ncbi:MAG TPA: hypothetical protein VL306_00205 [Methylomirabilota bacterium]|jgi:hypothetical protein|nr:hypothetical protein [Methylomirabilota bacterium]
MKLLLDPIFWLSQPPSTLTRADIFLGYFFLALVGVSIIIWIWTRFIRHSVWKKFIKQFEYLYLTIGLIGLLWFGIRYENTPIFACRYWMGIILLIAIIWKIFILKYLIFNFPAEVKDYNHEQIKNKYINSKR